MLADKISHIHGTGNRFIPALAPGTGESGLYTHGSGGLHQAKTLLTSKSDFWIYRNGKVWIDLPASSDTSNLIEMLLVTRNNIEFDIAFKFLERIHNLRQNYNDMKRKMTLTQKIHLKFGY